jgi:glucokinase
MGKVIVGVDIGGTNVKVGLVSLGGVVYKKAVFSTKAYPTKAKLIKALLSHIESLIAEGNIKRKDIRGIGIGSPGLVDSDRGIIHYLVNIAGFTQVPLKRIIEKRLRIPTFLDNDVNVVCLGELYYGRGKGARNMVCITLGTGVGGGIVINGALYRGSSLSAGEVGHATINEHGPSCNCGNYGCMETYVGNAAIVKHALRRLRNNKKSLMYELAQRKTSNITPKIISEAANRGDAVAKDILQETGQHIGVGLSTIVNILNPERIIIGGGVAEAGKILFDAIRMTVQKRAMRVPAQTVSIVKSKLGQDAGLIGAAALVKQATDKKPKAQSPKPKAQHDRY